MIMNETTARIILAGLKAIEFEPIPDPAELVLVLKSKRKSILDKLVIKLTKKEAKNINHIVDAVVTELLYLPTTMAEDFIRGNLPWKKQLNIWITLMERMHCKKYESMAKLVPVQLLEKFMEVAVFEKRCPYEEADEIYKCLNMEQPENKEKNDESETQKLLHEFNNALWKLENSQK